MTLPLHPFEARIRRTIQRWKMLGPADGAGHRGVLAGVSGGADSVSLVRALARLGIPFAIAHFDHGWRGSESRQDRDFVAALASNLGVRLHEGCAVAPDSGSRNEAQARHERHRFLDTAAQRGGYRQIALAHTRTDRTETFLMNLIRGSGSDGLSSMQPVSGRRIRPLIEVSRGEVEDYLETLGQPWRDDPTNRDPRFRRNKLRRDIIPELENLNPRLEDALARTMELLDDETEWMAGEARNWLVPRFRRDGGEFALAIDDLPRRPPAMVRHVLRHAIDQAQAGIRRPDDDEIRTRLPGVGFEHLEAVRRLLGEGKSGRTAEIPGPVHVERSFDSLRFFCANAPAVEYDRELPIPGVVDIPEIGRRFEARIHSDTARKSNYDRVFVDGESLGPCVRIRNWQKGDLYNPEGRKGATLKTLFQERRVPWRRRLEWPVVVAGSSIVWVASFPVSRDFAVAANSRKAVELVVSPL